MADKLVIKDNVNVDHGFELYLDGVLIEDITSYTLKHSADDIPRLTLEIGIPSGITRFLPETSDTGLAVELIVHPELNPDTYTRELLSR